MIPSDDPLIGAYYDEEEKELIESIERGEWVPLPEPERKKQMAIIKQAAKNTVKRLKKEKNMNIRMAEQDITDLKKLADEAGIPYQTLVTIALRQLARGKIKITL